MLLPARGPAKEVRACIQEILPVNKYLLTACLGHVSAEIKPPHPRPPLSCVMETACLALTLRQGFCLSHGQTPDFLGALPESKLPVVSGREGCTM